MKRDDLMRLKRTHLQKINGDDPACKPFFTVMATADKALAKFTEKRQELLDEGKLTPVGIAAQLRDDVDAFKARAQEITDTVLTPHVQKLTAQPTIPEAVDADRELVAAFKALPSGQRTRHLGRALAGGDDQLANALVRCHPMMTGLTGETLTQLKKRAGLAAEDGGAPLAAAHLAQQTLAATVNHMNEAVRCE